MEVLCVAMSPSSAKSIRATEELQIALMDDDDLIGIEMSHEGHNERVQIPDIS
jgi:hypothetical protein